MENDCDDFGFGIDSEDEGDDVIIDRQKDAMLKYEDSIFEKIYDKYGSPLAVPCDTCDYSYIVYIDGEYTCPTCWKVFSREYVFDWNEMKYWPECLRCNENLGNCYQCKYGHLDE